MIAPKATSVDSFRAEVVPVITQNSLKRLFCQGNSLRSGTAIEEEIPGTTKVEFQTFYISISSLPRPK
jgi:hypothetical protein